MSTRLTVARELLEELASRIIDLSSELDEAEGRIVEQKETIKRLRDRNSALRKERWDRLSKVMLDPTPPITPVSNITYADLDRLRDALLKPAPVVAPPSKVRVFRSVHGFGDGTDRVEVDETTGRAKAIDKRGHETDVGHHIDMPFSERAVVRGDWYEVTPPPAPPTPTPSVRVFRSAKEPWTLTERLELGSDGLVTVFRYDGTSFTVDYWNENTFEQQVADGYWKEETPPPFPKFDIRRHAEVVSRVALQEREATVKAALIHKFGTEPPKELLVKHLHRVIDHNRVEHWLWLDKKLEIGEKAPLDKAICRINPVSYTTNQES